MILWDHRWVQSGLGCLKPMRHGTISLWMCTALASGCFYPADRGRALEAKVDRMKEENEELLAELRRQQEKLTATLPKVDAKMAEMSEALESLDRAARRSDADIGVQMQKSIEDVAALRGQVETYLHRISELEAGLARISEDTRPRQADAQRKTEEVARPTDKKEFLAFAQDKAKSGEHAVSRQLFAEFLKKWPKDELSGEAHFGLGESFFSEEKCREALHEYGQVIQHHSKTRSAPQAYLRSADCFAKLKMLDESRLALEEVVRSYPKSEPAKLAKTRLAQLDKAKKVPPKKGKK